jgi:hypothetical protein
MASKVSRICHRLPVLFWFNTAKFEDTFSQLLLPRRIADIASFDQDGLAFQIHQPKRFAQEILPTYFPKMAKYSSFQRQLNLYNFEHDRKGTHRNTYQHELFQKDKPLLSLSMKRTKIKGTQQS